MSSSDCQVGLGSADSLTSTSLLCRGSVSSCSPILGCWAQGFSVGAGGGQSPARTSQAGNRLRTVVPVGHTWVADPPNTGEGEFRPPTWAQRADLPSNVHFLLEKNSSTSHPPIGGMHVLYTRDRQPWPTGHPWPPPACINKVLLERSHVCGAWLIN